MSESTHSRRDISLRVVQIGATTAILWLVILAYSAWYEAKHVDEAQLNDGMTYETDP